MLQKIKEMKIVKKVIKTPVFSRLRQRFPMPQPHYVDDQAVIAAENARVVTIDWPEMLTKPTVGLVRDYGPFPRWTKYARFLENNGFTYRHFDIHDSDWLQHAQEFDVVIGMPSSFPYQLEEMRRKYEVLEQHLGKVCYPSSEHTRLYEDKRLETYLADVYKLPFARTFLFHDPQEALAMVDTFQFPVVHKVDPSSGSMGTELIRDKKAYLQLVKEAFSSQGRRTHVLYFRQRGYIYIQEMIPNDGYDIRVILIGNQAFGYYRKTPHGDFRASGMNLVEKRGLPEEAIRIAVEVNKVIDSPQLVVDMLHGQDGRYYVIEYSPFCQVETAAQLQVDGEAGVYRIDACGNIAFEAGRYWVHELALVEFFKKQYLSLIVDERKSRLEYSHECGGN